MTAYGSWKSPISSDLIVAASIGLSSPTLSNGELFWVESRPQEGGRNVLVRRTTEGKKLDINPAPFNIRTRVHEYGGGAWLLHDNSVIFSNFSDQQLYRQYFDSNEPSQLTRQANMRFADGIIDNKQNRIICVAEEHVSDEVINKLVAVNLVTGEVTTLAEGHDFFAAPAISPDGKQLAWITWDHPDMPWDESQLWLANIQGNGKLQQAVKVSGGHDAEQKISVQQPLFSAAGNLYFISDKTGWWNIYGLFDGKEINLLPIEAEFGVPHWVFGQHTFSFPDEHHLLCQYSIKNESHIAMIDLDTLESTNLDSPYSTISGLAHGLLNDRPTLIYMGAAPDSFSSIVTQDLVSGNTTVIKQSAELNIGEGYYSTPETVEFPTGDDDLAHGFFYPPTNKDCKGLKTEKPPLLLMLHGGPTGATFNSLNLPIQYWTSRGIAVLDLNYRGSTGYGRAYRDKLVGNWGVTDVEDCVAACKYLVDQGLVDENRLAIRGGSAGGYTTLAALTFTNTFKAGASYYGVGDLEALAKDTHKFEARYLDSVVGAYPEQMEIYQQRSPIHHVDQLASACIFFQGLEDKVVPPNQAEAMVKALDQKQLPVAYVPFDGEQHGFRKSENIKRSLDLELYFYAKVFGFSTADQIEPVEIRNLPT